MRCFISILHAFFLFTFEIVISYPNFDDNPLIRPFMHEAIEPHLLPLDHPLKPALDEIFCNSRVTYDLESLQNAGFEILFVKHASLIVVVRHPLIPDHLIKLYIDKNYYTKRNRASWRWFVNRCIGAKKIGKIIKAKGLKHFVVPDKWIYPLPPIPTEGMAHPVILIVKDMKLTSREETRKAWMRKITPEHLDELYMILTRQCGSNLLINNVPYTKEGKFAFIDTENLYKKSKLEKIKQYISPDLHSYWDQLLKTMNSN